MEERCDKHTRQQPTERQAGRQEGQTKFGPFPRAAESYGVSAQKALEWFGAAFREGSGDSKRCGVPPGLTYSWVVAEVENCFLA